MTGYLMQALFPTVASMRRKAAQASPDIPHELHVIPAKAGILCLHVFPAGSGP
jgi:hypothetical protein